MIASGVLIAALLAAAPPAQTATGIPLDAPWKVTIYELARAKFHHPAWGWQHSERNYRVALELAQGDGLRIDDADSLDFLGDIGAARMISLTGESAASFAPAIAALRKFVREIPPRLVTKTAQRIGAERAAELQRLLDALNTETFDGQAM